MFIGVKVTFLIRWGVTSLKEVYMKKPKNSGKNPKKTRYMKGKGKSKPTGNSKGVGSSY